MQPFPLVLAGWRGFCADVTAVAPPTFTLRPGPAPLQPCAGAGAACAAGATLQQIGTATTVCATCAAQRGAHAQRTGHPTPTFRPLG